MDAPTPDRLNLPPSTAITFAVGVTGHRDLAWRKDIDVDGPDGLPHRVKAILKAIADAVLTFHGDARGLLQSGKGGAAGLDLTPPPTLRIISSLAQGADQLVAASASELLADSPQRIRYELNCPLPFQEDDYLRDFIRPDLDDPETDEKKKAEHPKMIPDEPAIAIFRRLKERARVCSLDYSRPTPATPGEHDVARAGGRGKPSSEGAYEGAARVMLAHSDLLIAVWDGKAERGRGGTAQVIREAIALRLPVIWIDVLAPHSCGFLEFDPDENAVAYAIKELPRTAFLDAPVVAADDWEHATSLDAYVRRVLSPPTTAADREGAIPAVSKAPGLQRPSLHKSHKKKGEPPPDIRIAYFADADPALRSRFWRGYSARYSNFFNRIAGGWNLSEPRRACDPRGLAIRDPIHRHYKAAESRAGYYSKLFRTSFRMNYFLGAWAVTIALVGGLATLALKWKSVGFLCAAVELFFLVCMLVNSKLRNHWHWHEKFTDFRLVTEQLRHLEFLATLGQNPTSRAPAHHPEALRESWTTWHVRNVAREAGLVAVNLGDEVYRASVAAMLQREWLTGQNDYHCWVKERNHNAEHRLHTFARNMLLLTVVACVTHLALDIVQWRLSEARPGTQAQGVPALMPAGHGSNLAYAAPPIVPTTAETSRTATAPAPVPEARAEHTEHSAKASAESAVPEKSGWDLFVEGFEVLLVLIAGMCPAWAGYAHGVADKADLYRLQERSAGMAKAMADLSRRLKKCRRDAPRPTAQQAIAQEAADTMLQEVSDWRVQYRMVKYEPG